MAVFCVRGRQLSYREVLHTTQVSRTKTSTTWRRTEKLSWRRTLCQRTCRGLSWWTQKNSSDVVGRHFTEANKLPPAY